ncbi:MAG TPA: DUF4157 domain-containing protein [Gammaproteobacteria bacterium]|nr:DUF4157 domain-containing protein [Gammaproteobacteria bacterium]
MKTRLSKELDRHDDRSASSHRRQRSARAGFDDRRVSSISRERLIQAIDNSPSMTLQRRQLDDGTPAPVQQVEDEELLQGKFDTSQRAPLEEEEPLQGKFEGLQRQGLEEEELMQGKFSGPLQREREGDAAPNRTGMPDGLKNGIESLSGIDLSAARIHYNSARPAQLNALAYAQGKDIHLGTGQEKHLPHEAWHLVQQQQGRVQPTTTIAGEQVNDDASLEREADIMGARALAAKK